LKEGVFGMKRFRLLGLALLAVFALGALMAASASAALPELLGNQAFPKSWTGKSVGTTELLTVGGAAVISCNAATADGEQLTDTLGDYHLHFTECKLVGAGPCSSEGDNSGVILTLGEYHYVDDFLGTPATLGVAILFLVDTHFICTPPGVLILVKGHVLCLILKPLESNVTHEFHCKETSGKSEDKHWWNDAGVEETALLLSNANEGPFEESAELALGTVTFTEKVAFMNH
jgi:hypothetical protein